ncbi:hypothetical protein P885DRAFT_76996 [Corynascus similis CBS 632.67]
MVGKKGASSGAKPKPSRTGTTNKKNQPKKGPASLSTKGLEDEPDQRQVILSEDRKHQQRVLDVFRYAFNEVFSSSSFAETLQSVKQALYDRDFARAFGDQKHLEVYAARWSPTRALCYASVLERVKEHLEPLFCSNPSIIVQDDVENVGRKGDALTNDLTQPQLNILSIGGGAAEIVALGAFLNQNPTPLSGAITLLDSGPWEAVITKLTMALTTPPPISKYASEAVRLANTAMVAPPSQLTPTFLQLDALALDEDTLSPLLGTAGPLLITLLFTLNELFTAGGVRQTTSLLLHLTAAVPCGSLLLVVDSPGSYSETTVGKEAKRYPMHWLLDRILLAEPPASGGRRWTKLESHESVWFRLAGEQQGAGSLDYPIALENMRYQMHLYRAEGANQPARGEENN